MSARDTQSDSPLLMDEAVLGYYHLQRDPFLPGNDFFTMPQWKDTIDMMTHFTRYSKLITIVTGVAGVGKSCFKKYFNSLVKANLYLGEISFDPQLNPAEIPSRIAKAFHLALTTPQANLAFDEAAKELLQQLMEMDKCALLAIDDADKWTVDLLNGVMRLYAIDNRFAERLRIIFYARPSIKTSLVDPLLVDLVKTYTHTIVLKPMTPLDAQKYIDFCLQSAGWKEGPPFTYAQLRSIFQSSQGVPGLVNQSASRLLIERAITNLEKQGELTMPSIIKRYPWQIISGLVLCAAVTSLFLLKGPTNPTAKAHQIANMEGSRSMQLLLPGQERAIDDEDEPYHMPEVATAMPPFNTDGQLLEQGTLGLGGMNADATTHPSYPQETQTSQQKIDITGDSADTTSASEEMSAGDVALTHTLPLVRQKTTLPEMPKVEQPASVTPPAAAVEQPTPKMTETTPTTTTQQREDTVVATTTTATTTPQKIELIKLPDFKPPQTAEAAEMPVAAHNLLGNNEHEKNLLSRAGNRYTIQLAGSNTEQSLMQFRRDNLLENQGIIVRTTRNGADWFVLLYGDYENQQDAVGALRQLPESLQQLKPWPRQMTSIQEMIKHRRS